MSVLIERHGEKRILAKVPFMNGHGSRLAKRIPGVTPAWDRGAGPDGKDVFRGWLYPLDLETCREIRKVFGDQLRIGPRLSAWARREARREADLALLRSGAKAAPSLPGLEKRAPLLAAALRPYQRTGAAFAVDGQNVLIADQPGLGKSLETLAALAERGDRAVLVFCRKTAMTSVWKREPERWLGDGCQVYVADGDHIDRVAIIQDFRSGATCRPDVMHILVCNIEMVRARKLCPDGLAEARCKKEHQHVKLPVKFSKVADYPELLTDPYDAVVVDESHRALIGRGTTSTAITQARLGMTMLPVAEHGLRLALSGTPFRGRNLDSWGTLNWLRPDVFTSYWRFAEMYFAVEVNEHGGREVGEVRPEREADFSRMLGAYMLRRTKAECAPELPPKQYADIWLEMEPAQAKAYRAIESDGDAQVRGGLLTAVGVLAEMTRLKQLACSAGRMRDGHFEPALPSNKLAWVLDFLEEREGNPGKVLIFSQFTQLIEMFSRELRVQHSGEIGMITGKTPQEDRDSQQEVFQDPGSKMRVMLLNTKAGGESITLDQADDVIFLDETWDPSDQEQAEDRAHRVSRVHPVTVYYLRSLGTIEEIICEATGQRDGAVKKVLDGSRGIEIRRRMIESRDTVKVN